MPLDPTLLATEIKTELQRLHDIEYPLSTVAMLGTHEIIANAVAAKVIAHFTANAVVLPTALVAPGGGGPVTGVGTVT